MKKYLFIDSFDINLLDKQDRNTAIIFRNYKIDIKRNLILTIKNYCKKKNIKFFLSNDIKLAINLGLDGAYVPSFNKSFEHLSYSLKSNFILLGSAHSNQEIQIKERQKVRFIFLSSLFKKNKNYLGINRFKIIAKKTGRRVVALGGISKKNLKQLNLVNCCGFAGISFFE